MVLSYHTSFSELKILKRMRDIQHYAKFEQHFFICIPAVIFVDGSAGLGSTRGGLAHAIMAFSVDFTIIVQEA